MRHLTVPRLPGVPEAPADGDYATLPGGILWIRLPIPGGLRHINVWLLPVRGGWLLVDTGMDTADIRHAWRVLEERLPLQRELQGILVTHHHPDHFGMAQWLADRHGVPVQMTQAAHAAATRGLARDVEGTPTNSEDFARRHGLDVDEEMRRILRGGIYRAIVSGAVTASEVRAGDRIDAIGGSWTVSVHEGHAPGHACLYDAGSGVLVSGDQLLPSISSNISLYPSNELEDPLGQYLESLQALYLLPGDTLVLPSHGNPFASLQSRARALREEHEDRLRSIGAALSSPMGTMDVAGRLFRLDRLDTLNRLLALTETLAHLRWLEVRGLVARTGEGEQLRWFTTGSSAGHFALQHR
jgi:glyoxylase-like metal-dependent hydrolase (beta-lactamase superfamily II)